MDAAEPVRSAQNARLKAVRALRAGREREAVLLEGRHLLAEALRADAPLAWVLHREGAEEGELGALLAAARERGVEVRACDAALLREVSDLDAPADVLAWGSRRTADWEEMLAAARAGDWWLVAAGVQDPGNLGALVRVAAGLGAAAFAAVAGGGSPWHPRALRGASGTTWRLPVAERVDAEALCAAAAERGVALWGLDAGGEDVRAAAAERTPRDAPLMLLVGAEGAGLDPALAARCTLLVGIPLARGVESLNVAAAAAVAAWEITRAAEQRDA